MLAAALAEQNALTKRGGEGLPQGLVSLIAKQKIVMLHNFRLSLPWAPVVRDAFRKLDYAHRWCSPIDNLGNRCRRHEGKRR
jgi:hypothetical protein